MSTAGIDNGLDGAISILNDDGSILFFTAMPCRKDEQGKRRVDDRAILVILREHKPTSVCIERPGGSKNYSAAVSMRDSYARTETVVRLLAIPHISITPQAWQKTFWKRPADAKQTGWTTKLEALRTAQTIWPNQSFIAPARRKVAHDGIVDALLIAEYHRRNVKDHAPTTENLTKKNNA